MCDSNVSYRNNKLEIDRPTCKIYRLLKITSVSFEEQKTGVNVLLKQIIFFILLLYHYKYQLQLRCEIITTAKITFPAYL